MTKNILYWQTPVSHGKHWSFSLSLSLLLFFSPSSFLNKYTHYLSFSTYLFIYLFVSHSLSLSLSLFLLSSVSVSFSVTHSFVLLSVQLPNGRLSSRHRGNAFFPLYQQTKFVWYLVRFQKKHFVSSNEKTIDYDIHVRTYMLYMHVYIYLHIYMQ